MVVYSSSNDMKYYYLCVILAGQTRSECGHYESLSGETEESRR